MVSSIVACASSNGARVPRKCMLLQLPDELLLSIIDKLPLADVRLFKVLCKRCCALSRRALSCGCRWEVVRVVSTSAVDDQNIELVRLATWYERSPSQFMLGLEHWDTKQAVKLVATMSNERAGVLRAFVSSLQFWQDVEEAGMVLRELLSTGHVLDVLESGIIAPLEDWECPHRASMFLQSLGSEAPLHRIAAAIETWPLMRTLALLGCLQRTLSRGAQFALEVCVGLWRWRTDMEKAGRVLASLSLARTKTVLTTAKLIYFFVCTDDAGDDGKHVHASEMLRGWCLAQQPVVDVREVRNQLRQQTAAMATGTMGIDHGRWVRAMTYAWKRRKVDPDMSWYTMRMHCEGFDSAPTSTASES